jgi:hypothetical protein
MGFLGKLLKHATRAFVTVLFILLGMASEGFPDASKANVDDTAPKVLEALAQGDPQESVKEEKSLTGSETSPGVLDKKTGTEKSKEPSSPFKDFVPSEKIDADKAVDFPVDI